MTKEKKFCGKCGNELVADDRITSYDEYTGEPIRLFIHQKTCSNTYCDKSAFYKGL